MYFPKEHQKSGAAFLAERRFAILADEPRVGKTGSSITAADMIGARTIAVVTTASGRPVWRRGFHDWSMFGRSMQVLGGGKSVILPNTEVAIIGWPDMKTSSLAFQQVFLRQWDVIIFDEFHYGKNIEAARTQAAFGDLGLHTKAENVWCLSGTPMPNSPFDLYPVLAAKAPERLKADAALGWPDVSDAEVFKRRYCKIKPKKIGFYRWIDVIIGGQNLEELHARMKGLYLLRTQQDVGITGAQYEILPLLLPPAALKQALDADRSIADTKVLQAIQSGDADAIKEEHLGPVRRLWGELKIKPLVEALTEEFNDGLQKVVIMAWHSDVIAGLAHGLAKFGVTGVDGSTSAKAREANVHAFQTDPKVRVFIGQIQAASEAIDLSAATELVFAESSFQPAQMKQAALRITNFGQAGAPRVRVATIEGSIDDAIQSSLLRKWAAIKEVIK